MEIEKGSEKKVYTTPKLVVYGGVERITQGNSLGLRLDADFTVGTLFGDLTFS